MTLTVNDFVSNLKTNGIQRQNRFEVNMLGVPTVLSTVMGLSGTDVVLNEFGKRFALAARNVNIGGFNIMTTERNVNDFIAKVGYDVEFSECDITFMCSGDAYERKLFCAWKDSIIQQNKMVEYYDNYITDIQIILKDVADETVYAFTLVNAYPTTVTSLNMDNESLDSMVTFQVTFTFKKLIEGSYETNPNEITAAIKAQQQAQRDAQASKTIPPVSIVFKNQTTPSYNFNPNDILVVAAKASQVQHFYNLLTQIKNTTDPKQAIVLAKSAIYDIRQQTGLLGDSATTSLLQIFNNAITVLGGHI